MHLLYPRGRVLSTRAQGRRSAGAVLTWIISGAKRFINNGHVIPLPDCVRESNNRYREDSDWFNEFLVDNCEVDKGFCEKSGELYAQYKKFCEDTGEYKRSLLFRLLLVGRTVFCFYVWIFGVLSILICNEFLCWQKKGPEQKAMPA